MSASSKKARRATGPSPKGDTGDEPSTKANGTDGLPQAVVDELPGALVEVVARLTNVRELEGGGYVARCPVCSEDDKFTVIAGETQPVVVNCYRASCMAHDGHVLGIVAEALGVEESALLDPTHVPSDKIRKQFTERHRVAAQQKKAPEPLPHARLIAEWQEALSATPERLGYLSGRGLTEATITTYELGWDQMRHCYTLPVRDAAGELVNLRRHWPDRKPKMMGLAGRGSQLYPWADLAADDPQALILYCAGEFDALICRQHGIRAVTSTTGASLPRHLAPEFKGRTVAVAFDVGESKSARKVAKRLGARVVHLPLPNDGDDLTDWFVTYDKTADELRALIDDDDDSAEIAALIEEAARKLRINEGARDRVRRDRFLSEWREPPSAVSLKHELTDDRSPLEWRVGQLHVLGGNTLLSAMYKAGKTTLLLNLTAAMADDRPFLDGYSVRRPDGRIAFWNFEVSDRQFLEWAEKVGIKNTDAVCAYHLRGFAYDPTIPEVQDHAVRWLRSHEVEVWIVDPFAASFYGEENSNSEVTRHLRALDEIKSAAGVSDLFLAHHFGRQGEHSRGATRLDDWADSLWKLKLSGDTRAFEAQGRDVGVVPQTLVFDPETHRLSVAGTAEQVASAADDRRLTKLLVIVRDNDGIGAEKLKVECGGSAKRHRPTVERALDLGLVSVKDKDGRAKKYSLTNDGREWLEDGDPG